MNNPNERPYIESFDNVTQSEMVNSLLREKHPTSRWIHWPICKISVKDRKEHDDYKALLTNMPLEELVTHYIHQQKRFRLFKKFPPFYNAISGDANFELWSKQAFWTVDEGICLLFGIEPEKSPWNFLEPYKKLGNTLEFIA